MTQPEKKLEPMAYLHFPPKNPEVAKLSFDKQPPAPLKGLGYVSRPRVFGDPVQGPRDPVCPRCDGSGDVHSLTGEWRGECDCSPPTEAPKKDPPYVRKNDNDRRNP